LCGVGVYVCFFLVMQEMLGLLSRVQVSKSKMFESSRGLAASQSYPMLVVCAMMVMSVWVRMIVSA